MTKAIQNIKVYMLLIKEYIDYAAVNNSATNSLVC